MSRPSVEKQDTGLLSDALLHVGFESDHLERLRAIAPRIAPRLPEMAEAFYRTLLEHPEAARVFSGPAQVERLKRTLVQWTEELLTLPRDEAYFEKRMRVGEVHVALGVPPRYILGSIGLVRRFLVRAALAAGGGPAEAEAIEKACDVDAILLTESYRLSERVRENEAARARLEALLEQAPVGVVGYDRAGTVVYENAAAKALLETSLAGRNALVLFVGGEASPGTIALARILAGETVGPVERTLATPSGRKVRVLLVHAPLRAQDASVVGGYAFLLDATELAALRERMFEEEKLAALGRLAGGLAHEIGNPLASISAAAQLLARRAEGPARETAEAIRAGVRRIEGAIRNLRDFAREGRAAGPAEVGATLDGLEPVLRLDPRLRGVTIARAIEDGLRLPLSSDALAQVLYNLLANAAEAMGGKGTIRVAARREDGGLLLAVEDEGPGFSHEALARACDPFFTTKPEGTGLGLAVTRAAVEAAGGRLSIANRPEGGARVTARFPYPATR